MKRQKQNSSEINKENETKLTNIKYRHRVLRRDFQKCISGIRAVNKENIMLMFYLLLDKHMPLLPLSGSHVFQIIHFRIYIHIQIKFLDITLQNISRYVLIISTIRTLLHPYSSQV
jgi:hypothetical protein